MATNVVGSVTAQLLLDTKEFTAQLNGVKNQVKDLNNAFKYSDASKMAEEIERLHNQLKKSTDVIKEQEQIIDKLKKGYDNLRGEVDSLNKVSEKLRIENDKIASSNDKVTKSTGGLKEAMRIMNTETAQMSRYMKQFGGSSSNLTAFMNKFLNFKNQGLRGDSSKVITDWSIGFKRMGVDLKQLGAEMTHEISEFNRLKSTINELGSVARKGAGDVANFHAIVDRIYTISAGLKGNWVNSANTLQSQLSGFMGMEEWESYLAKWSEASGKVTSGMSAFAQSNSSVRASLQETHDALVSVTASFERFDEIISVSQQSLKRFGATTPNLNSFKMNLNEIYELMAQNGVVYERGINDSKRWSEAVKSSAVSLQDYYKNITKAQESTVKYTSEQQKLVNQQQRISSVINNSSGYYSRLKTSLDGISTSSGKVNSDLQRFAEAQAKLGNTLLSSRLKTDESSRSMDKYGESTKQATTKSEALNSATGKLKQGLSALKMTLSMVSSMFIWTFGMSLWEATKQTVQSKNEMESYLNQMGMSRGSIAVFNRGLDDTVARFKKLNKFMIGETIAGVGMEFDLTARQMAKGMEVVAMIQNEYVRAGRKEEEATLAVKDILQGEFLRLSRETGVGKQDLIDTGLWSGDLKDIEGLMDALKQVGTDRHWDLFASKCNSISDVVSTAKNRISEFTATLIDEASPIIVESFNAIIGVVDWLTGSWNNMNATMKMLVSGGLITAFATGILMIGKNMGLVQIATNGFTNSLVGMILKMEASQVKSLGLAKSITTVITGLEAETVADLGSAKAIATRLLGLDATIVKQHGFATAIKVAKEGLIGEDAVTRANILGKQKLTTVLKESIISWKALKIAIMGVMALGIIVFLGSLAQECQRAKESVDTFYEVVDNGKEILEDTQKTYDKYVDTVAKLDEKLNSLQKGSAEYNKVLNQRNTALHNQHIAYQNLGNIQKANAKAQEYNGKLQQKMNDINLGQQSRMIKIYEGLGYSTDEATEKAFKYAQEVENGYNIINEAYDMYEAKLNQASGHMDIQAKKLQEVGATQEQVNRYLQDYNAEAYKVAEYWSEFKQGDFWAIFKVALGELTLMWIDIANHPEVVKLMNGLGKACEEFAPVLDWIANGLATIGLYLAKFSNWMLSTSLGRAIASWTGFGAIIGVVGLKLGSVIFKTDGMVGALKKLIPHLSKAIDKIKDYVKASEESGLGDVIPTGKDKSGGKDGGKTGGKTGGTTGGKNSPIYTDWSKTSFGEVAKSDFKDNARNFLKMAEYLAMAMALVTEAIILLNAPMLALAGTGMVFKAVEPQIRAGIEGLKLIAPVVLALLPPIIVLMAVMEKFGNTLDGNWGSIAKNSAIGIALGIGLVAETIIMLVAPLVAIASLGWVAKELGKDNLNGGLEAIKLTGESLGLLVPFVPVLLLGVALAFALMTEVGAILTIGVVVGIALGMVLLAEAIITLHMPLMAIASLGKTYKDLGDVKQGAEAIKQTGIALQYLSEATSSIGAIAWDSFLTFLLTDGKSLQQVTAELTQDGNIISAMGDFAEQLNNMEIKPINATKVEELKTLAESMKTVGDGLTAVYESLNALSMQQAMNGSSQIEYSPEGEVKSLLGMQLTKMQTVIEDISNFAEQVNNMTVTAINSEIASTISNSSESISNIKSAVDNITATMGGIVDANFAGAGVSGGILSSIGNYLWHGGDPSTGYTSSLGTPLIALERAVQDLFTFNSRINQITGGGTSDSSGAVSNTAGVVAQISQMITDITNTLSSGLNQIKSTSTTLGEGIISGIETGVNNKIGGMESTIKGKMKSMGENIANEFKNNLKGMSDAMGQEMNYIGQKIDNMKPTLKSKAKSLGAEIVQAFKDGLDYNSPALLSRTMASEMEYIYEAISNNSSKVIGAVKNLATDMTENFAPSITTTVDLDIGDEDALAQYRKDSMIAMGLADDTVSNTESAFSQLDTQTALTFNSIGGTIGTTMTNIANNTKSNYNTLAVTTKTQLGYMQSETTKNINQIKDSWNHMQDALIQSAENIRSETGSKIRSLESNMGSFWRKVQNPALLLGAGSPSEENKGARPRRYGGSGVSRVLRGGGFAGGLPTGAKASGIPNRISSGTMNIKMLDALDLIYEAMEDGKPHYFGGWNFNWSDDIKRALLQWHTHFGQIYDPYLYVGKFENDNFPVRGIPEIARNYIYDAISRTSYEFYYDSKYGSPLASWNAGHFNCYDGALLVMALASAFGFTNSHMVHGSWNGIPHVWAYIQGLGEIDATAIQGGYGLTAPSRTGAMESTLTRRSAGGISRFKHNKDPHSDGGNNINGDVHIHIDGSDKDSKEIGNEVRNVILDLFSPNPTTGH